MPSWNLETRVRLLSVLVAALGAVLTARADMAPPPALPTAEAARVQALSKELRAAVAEADEIPAGAADAAARRRAALMRARERADQVLRIRVALQGPESPAGAAWIASEDRPGTWHEVTDAARMVQNLDTRLSADDHAEEAFKACSVAERQATRLSAGGAAMPEVLQAAAAAESAARRAWGAAHPTCLKAQALQGSARLFLHTSGVPEPGPPPVAYLEPAVAGLESALGAFHPDTIYARFNLSLALREERRFRDSEGLAAASALAATRVFPAPDLTPLTCLNGWAYIALFNRHLSSARRADELAMARASLLPPGDPLRVEAVTNSAMLAAALGRPQDAEAMLRELLAAGVEGDEGAGADARMELAQALAAQRKFDEADALMAAVVEARRAAHGDTDESTLVALNDRAAMLAEAGRFEQAAALARAAHEGFVSARGKTDAHALFTASTLARALMGLNQHPDAEAICDMIIELLRRPGVGNPGALADALSNRAHLLADPGFNAGAAPDPAAEQARLERAASDFAEALRLSDTLRMESPEDLESRARYAGQVELPRLAAELATTQMRLGRADAAFDAAERGRARSALDLMAGSPDEGASAGGARPPLMSAAQLAKRLAPDEAILQIVWTDSRVLSVLLRPDGVRGWWVAENGKATEALAAAVADLRRAASTGEVPRMDAATAGPALLLTPPDPEWLRGVERVVVIPTGPAATAPLEMLLADRRVTRAPSASILAMLLDRPSAPIAAGSAVLAGAPPAAAGVRAAPLAAVEWARGGAPALPGAAAELRTVESLLIAAGMQTAALTGPLATRAALERAAAARPPAILHLATHGVLGDPQHPLESGLLLAPPLAPEAGAALPATPDVLTLEDLVQQWPSRLQGCQVVTLSACDTGHGAVAGDTELSLPLGFLAAGARCVVATLWPVADGSTSLLMERFYGNLLGRTESERRVGAAIFPAGTALPPAEALEESRTWLRTLPWEEATRRLAALDPAAATRLRGAVVQVGANGASGAAGAAGAPNAATPPPPFASPACWAGFVLIGAHR